MRYPREIRERAVTVRRVEVGKELKVVQLRGGKKVDEVPYSGRESHGFGSGRDTQKAEGEMKLDNPEKRGIRTTTVIEIENVAAHEVHGSVYKNEGSHVYCRNVLVSMPRPCDDSLTLTFGTVTHGH